MASHKFKLRFRRAPSAPVVGNSFNVTGTTVGESLFSAFTPKLMSRQIWRTKTVAAGDEFINLQTEVALPQSPGVTTWTISGPDVDYFQAGSTNGTIVFKSATRAALASRDYIIYISASNTPGISNSSILTVTLPVISATPSLNKEWFLDYNSGLNTTFDTGAFAKPWKHLPGSYLFSGTGKTFGADDVVFVKAGNHKTAFFGSGTVPYGQLSHTGTSGHPFVIEMNGWGGRAVIDGSVDITGAASVTQSEISGNTNYTNIVKYDLTSQGGAIELFQGVYNGNYDTETGTTLFNAQYPRPSDPWITDQRDASNSLGSELYGLRNLPIVSSGAGPRIYSSGTTITIVDSQIATLFGAVDVSTLPRFKFLNSSNNISSWYPDTYDSATGTVTFTRALSLEAAGSKGAYAMSEHPALISAAGQFAFSRDGLTLYVWRNNTSSPVSITRKYWACDWVMGGGYVKYNGGAVQRFANGILRAGGDTGGGSGFQAWCNSTYFYESDVCNVFIRQMNSDTVFNIYRSAGSTGLRSSNVEMCTFEETEASGMRFTGSFDGDVQNSTSKPAIRAGLRGKIRNNYWKRHGTNQTAIFLNGSNGIHIYNNCFVGNKTLHGNCISHYSLYVADQYGLIEYNDFIDSARAYTTNTVTDPCNMTFEGNFILNPNTNFSGSTNAGISCYGGLAGGEICRNVSMGYDSSYSTNDTSGIAIGSGGTNTNIHNNVTLGIYLPDSIHGYWTGSIINNLNTTSPNSPTYQGNGGTYSGNIQYTSGAQQWYFTSFNSDMISTLGTGPIGLFRSI